MPSLLSQLSPGKVLYRLWHEPSGKVVDFFRAGGPIGRMRTEAGRRQMEAAAYQLPSLPERGTPLTVHLLTGERFWYQTALCLWTFSHQAKRTLAPVLYDDGTLSPKYRKPLARVFPLIRFVGIDDTVPRLDEQLPVSRFPTLRERWRNYPHIRKLIDPHLGSSGWKLVIDSDLLFFRTPTLLVDWIESPTKPLHAVDCETSYGYSRPLLDGLAGRPLAELVNVGLTGLRSEDVDWERLEAWTAALHAAEGTHYYLEQALIAMLVAGRDCTVAPASDYVTFPVPPETTDCRAVMHHYVADSKCDYFRRCWHRAVDGPSPAPHLS